MCVARVADVRVAPVFQRLNHLVGGEDRDHDVVRGELGCVRADAQQQILGLDVAMRRADRVQIRQPAAERLECKADEAEALSGWTQRVSRTVNAFRKIILAPDQKTHLGHDRITNHPE